MKNLLLLISAMMLVSCWANYDSLEETESASDFDSETVTESRISFIRAPVDPYFFVGDWSITPASGLTIHGLLTFSMVDDGKLVLQVEKTNILGEYEKRLETYADTIDYINQKLKLVLKGTDRSIDENRLIFVASSGKEYKYIERETPRQYPPPRL